MLGIVLNLAQKLIRCVCVCVHALAHVCVFSQCFTLFLTFHVRVQILNLS